MSIAEKITTIAENEEKVFKAGKTAERDEFWEKFQTAIGNSYDYVFYGAGWNDDTFYPKYDIKPKPSAISMFRYCRITDLEARLNECGVVLDTSQSTTFSTTFSHSSFTVLPVIDLSNAQQVNGTFASNRQLKTIRKIISSPYTVFTSNMFSGCDSLENIVIEGLIYFDINFSSCPLSVESMKSVISALVDLVELEEEFCYTVTFSSACLTALDEDGNTSPNGNTWREYAADLGWNVD